MTSSFLHLENVWTEFVQAGMIRVLGWREGGEEVVGRMERGREEVGRKGKGRRGGG